MFESRRKRRYQAAAAANSDPLTTESPIQYGAACPPSTGVVAVPVPDEAPGELKALGEAAAPEALGEAAALADGATEADEAAAEGDADASMLVAGDGLAPRPGLRVLGKTVLTAAMNDNAPTRPTIEPAR